MYEKALQKIKEYEKCKSNFCCCSIIGPTRPQGEPGQLELTLNGSSLAYTVVGRATGTSQIIGLSLITTTTINSVLTVRNPADNSTAFTITPLAGGTQPVSAHLVITQIQ